MDNSNIQCPVCESPTAQVFFEAPEIPVFCNVLLRSQEEALQIPRGNIHLAFCSTCGHVFNADFKPELVEYTPDYENSLHFSPRFQGYIEDLTAGLVSRYDLRDKTVIDIGCGKGDFLIPLCELAGSHGIGFDPSYSPDPSRPTPQNCEFVRDLYSERYSSYQADLICCRHVLEHIDRPRDFLLTIRRSIGGHSTAVFFEVPNILYTLDDMGIWDLIYEHVSYFSPSSLSYLFTTCGFAVQRQETTYGGQFLTIEAAPVAVNTDPNSLPPNLIQLTGSVRAFAENYRTKVNDWRHNLGEFKAMNRRVVIWGGGSKGVTFLNVLRARDHVGYVVDINPRKHGMYVAGSGQEVVPPEFLQQYKPDVVLIMNPLYQNEIQQQVAELGLTPEFMCV